MGPSDDPLVLLTGATGYVGGRLLRALENAGHRVRCLARRPAYLGGKTGFRTEVVEGDVDVVDLLRREVDVREDLEDVLGGKVALLLAFIEQHADFLDRAEDRIVGLPVCC